MQYVDPARDTSIALVDLRAHVDPVAAAAHVWLQREIATPVDLSVDRLVQTCHPPGGRSTF
ncbi:hypothetical protein GS531_11345, partial [Rhodococcus hoagii]|nr:hypothetical protein [Prescottella equi]